MIIDDDILTTCGADAAILHAVLRDTAKDGITETTVSTLVDKCPYLGASKIRSAIAVLVEDGILTPTDAPKGAHNRRSFAKIAQPKRKIRIADMPECSIEEVLHGLVDDENAIESGAALACFTLWCETWSIAPNPAASAAWFDAWDNSIPPSKIAKATIGMKSDKYEQRREYCSLQTIQKDLDKWLTLFAANGFKAKSSKRSTTHVEYDEE